MNSPPKSTDSLPTCEALLAAAIGSEPDAWRNLVTLYEPRITRWCHGQGLDRIATSDVIQDTWISVARGLGCFRSQPGTGAFRAWLHKIVRRRIADYRRREGHAVPAVGGSSFAMRLAELPFEGEPRSNSSKSETSPSLAMDPPGLAARGQTEPSLSHAMTSSATSQAVVRQAMAIVQGEVEPKTWQAFWLSVIDQHSTEEVAELLEMTPANVRQSRSRVLRRLRQSIVP